MGMPPDGADRATEGEDPMRYTLPILLTAIVLLPAAGAETRFEARARKNQEIAKTIVWPHQEPPMFYLRRGRAAENYLELYEGQHAPENIKRMAAAGVRWGRPHFYKGLGLQTEMPEIKKPSKWAR